MFSLLFFIASKLKPKFFMDPIAMQARLLSLSDMSSQGHA